ncbi:hypothetical protein C3489_01470 [Streptomyces sp. Ru71]|nr:hypothetical protein C3489_01470 [Streptomyces sp. Ru71]
MAATLSIPAFVAMPADADADAGTVTSDSKATGQCKVPGKVHHPWVDCGHLNVGPAEVLSIQVSPFWQVTKATFDVRTSEGEKLAFSTVDAKTGKPKDVWANPSTSIVTVHIKASSEKKGFLQAKYRTRISATSTVPFKCKIAIDPLNCGTVKVADRETVWVKLASNSPVTVADFDAQRNAEGYGLLDQALAVNAHGAAKPVWTNDTGKTVLAYMRVSAVAPLAENENPMVFGSYFTRPGEPEEAP